MNELRQTSCQSGPSAINDIDKSVQFHPFNLGHYLYAEIYVMGDHITDCNSTLQEVNEAY